MLKRNQGHIINISSLASHQVYPSGVVYCATKFLLRAISEGLKIECSWSPIRISSVDPGAVETNFLRVRFKGGEERAKGHPTYQGGSTCRFLLKISLRRSHFTRLGLSRWIGRKIKIYPTVQTAAHMVNRSE